MRYFNTEGLCRPEMHYMVRLDNMLAQIRQQYVDRGSYFVINRGRQYGKTTLLRALAENLKDTYIVIMLDFQKMGSREFSDEVTFSHSFMEDIVRRWNKAAGHSDMLPPPADDRTYGLKELFIDLSALCEHSPRPVVLIIDEVDSASNNQVFIDFLAQLRGYYLERDETPVFHSVVLAGVYDIINLKLKLRTELEHQYNSPWNIAASFDIDMNFSAGQIASMLREYEAEQQTGIALDTVAEEIYAYTSGYPVLVSSICKYIDEKLEKAWSKESVAEAVKMILKGSTPLFESMVKQLELYRELSDMIEGMLYQGHQIPFEIDVKPVSIGKMFGFLKEEDGHVAVANRMFEMKLLNTLITKEALKSASYRSAQRDKNQFVEGGRLNMTLLLKKFVTHFHEVYDQKDETFLEDNGRKFFLLYLKPIINGTGNYYIEAQTRDARRTDVIVDYGGEQFIVELKIWRGKEYHDRGERQLTEYLDYYHTKRGYLISFNFNQKKESGVKELMIGDKVIVEAVV